MSLPVEDSDLFVGTDSFDAGRVVGFWADDFEGLVEGDRSKVREREVVLDWSGFGRGLRHWVRIGWQVEKGIAWIKADIS